MLWWIICVASMVLELPACRGVTRQYFLTAEHVQWDYAPSGKNLVDPQQQSEADEYLKHDWNRIGKIYKKTIYKQYTDNTFTKEIPKPPWLGLVGPIMRAEVGDVIVVNFWNRADRVFSVHPHGLIYDKEHEGAMYEDGTHGVYKVDDAVPPGHHFRYVWSLNASSTSPAASDPDCLPWVYHSHVNTPPDTSTGLIGVLVTCKRGTLDAHGELKATSREYVLVVKAFDENLSWLAKNNSAKCGRPQACLNPVDADDYAKSNIMYSINGLMYGHLTGLDACVGDNITWHVIGMGNEIDVHSVHFHGQSLHSEHRSGDTVAVFAAVFKTARMTARLPGRWLISCMVAEHFTGGMSAFLNISSCGERTKLGAGNGKRNSRWYYLAVEEEEWDYGPSGLNKLTGTPLNQSGSPSEMYFAKRPHRIGGKYHKVRYHQYDDLSYSTKKSSDPALGILGPVIRAEVGDNVNVVLKNLAQRPFSFVGHSLLYGITDEGTYDGVFHHGIVQAGATHVYHLRVPDDLLSDADPDCMVQLYHSAVNEARDINSGLIGPLLICRRGKLGSDHKQMNISREFYLLFATFDENMSWYLDKNIHKYCSHADGVNKEDDDFQESNRMHGLNGRSFLNLEGLTMCLGDNVTWHTMAYGSETDVQSPYFHGNTYTVGGTHRDTGHLISGGTQSVMMTPDNPGTWMVTSDNSRLLTRGAAATYSVTPCHRDPFTHYVSGVTRRHLIAAEEVEWDYAPSGVDHITGADLSPPSTDFIFTRDDNDFIGRKYKKAIYREYTDLSFATRKPRNSDDVHLGIMGPMIKAEVGDVIEIVFKNKASRHYSMHAHGLLYDKANAGYSYADHLFLEAKKGVAPNELFVYRWHVPPRAGPGPEDPNCIPWLYSSGVDVARDPVTGLVGAVIVCRKGVLDGRGKRLDVDREFVLLFSIFDENLSWYLRDNIERHAPGRLNTQYEHSADFEESNKMHSVNGVISANNEGLVMDVGDTTAWHLLAVGTETDLHTVHFHGHSFTQRSNRGHRTDVLAVFPSNAETVTMVTDNPGTWILHCHVLDHITAGMETVYTVRQAIKSRT